MITIDDIIYTHNQLETRLKNVLAKMELTDELKEIRAAIKLNQERCPHYSTKYNWVHDGKCPYCGKEE